MAETKFHPPLLDEDFIARSHLSKDLRDSLTTQSLTLLSAPAGYGKTTLLAALPQTYTGLPFAWLSLDEEDNDPARFLTALILALQRLDPACGSTAGSLLTGLTNPGDEARRVTGVLINDILESLSEPFALILDDLHLIGEPSIFGALDYLLEHRPAPLHLGVATRVDPPLALARLRARGQLAELRLGELRFRPSETRAFLNDRLRLGLSDDELALLQSRTEGWPVGLRLLAGSLDGVVVAEERKAFIQHLTQTDRYIFDFLAEEVFNRQEAELREFLLETSILPELNRTLCRAVSHRPDASALLDELYRRNVFLAQVSPASARAAPEYHHPHSEEALAEARDRFREDQYRYHDLFAEFLRKKLHTDAPERIPGLHLRAARAESDPTRAVAHFLAARKWEEAADMIEQIGAGMFTSGYLDTLSRWIKALPLSVQQGRPRLLHLLSNCAFWKGDFGQVQSLLEQALTGFEAAGDEAGQGEVFVNLAICASAQGDLERSGALFGQALAYPIAPHTRVQALLGRALSEGGWGDWSRVERDFNAAMKMLHQGGELDELHLMTFYFFEPSFAFLPGGLEHLERICRQAQARVGDEVSLSRLAIEEVRTILKLFRGRLEDGIRSGERALALRERLGGHPFLGLDAALFLMLAHAARGNFGAVEPLFDQLLLGVDQVDLPPPDLPIYLFYIGRVRWLQGRLDEACNIRAQMRALIEQGSLGEAPELRICCAWMDSLLETSEGRYRNAERILRQPEVLEHRDRARPSTMHGSTRLMLARLYWEQDRRQEALAELTPTLAYHEQLGIPFAILLEGQSILPLLRSAVEQGVYARYASELLDMLGADEPPLPVHVPRTGETLTPREVEVLNRVMAGDSNRAIAERLVISEWTVKSHLTNIYRKLDVNSRTQAISCAQALGLG